MANEITISSPPSAKELLTEMARKATDPQTALEIAKQVVELEVRFAELEQSRDRFEWEKLERQAKVAFAEAFNKFKDNAPKILKTKHVHFESRKEGASATSYWHVELDKACNVLIPALMKVGITHRWKSADLPGGYTRVTCLLRHKQGYEEEGASLSGPTDLSGGKNPIQGVGSSTSYLERYTLLASLGLVAAGKDDDGAGGGINNEEASAFIEAINTSDTFVAAMTAWGSSIDAAKKMQPVDYRAMTIFTDARDIKLKELRKAQ